MAIYRACNLLISKTASKLYLYKLLLSHPNDENT